jgi:hypothetical protein
MPLRNIKSHVIAPYISNLGVSWGVTFSFSLRPLYPCTLRSGDRVVPVGGLDFLEKRKCLTPPVNWTTIPRMSGVLRSDCKSWATPAHADDAVRKPVDWVSVFNCVIGLCTWSFRQFVFALNGLALVSQLRPWITNNLNKLCYHNCQQYYIFTF